LRSDQFLMGQPVDGSWTKDATWRREDGNEFGETDWHDPGRRFIALELFEPGGAPEVPEDHVHVIVNGGERRVPSFPLRTVAGAWSWIRAIRAMSGISADSA
jgi:pullulanase/glycogen debranching enzyme